MFADLVTSRSWMAMRCDEILRLVSFDFGPLTASLSVSRSLSSCQALIFGDRWLEFLDFLFFFEEIPKRGGDCCLIQMEKARSYIQSNWPSKRALGALEKCSLGERLFPRIVAGFSHSLITLHSGYLLSVLFFFVKVGIAVHKRQTDRYRGQGWLLARFGWGYLGDHIS